MKTKQFGTFLHVLSLSFITATEVDTDLYIAQDES